MSESLTITDNVLAHYGVKGMKWGVRKDKKSQKYRSTKGMAVGRNIDPNLQINPNEGLFVRDPKERGTSKRSRRKDGIGIMADSFRAGNAALDSPDLWQKLNSLNAKFNTYEKRGPGTEANRKYLKEFTSLMNAEFSKHDDPSKNIKLEVIANLSSDGSMITSFTYLYGDPSQFPRLTNVSHSETVDGVIEREIKVVYDDSGSRIIKLIMDQKTYDFDERSTVGHTFAITDNVLAHYGVKGMKWGVRKDRKGNIKARSTITRRDNRHVSDFGNPLAGQSEKFEKAYNKIYSKSAGKIRSGVRAINKSEKYKGKDFRFDSPLRREYYNDVSKMMNQQLNASAASVRTGRYQLNFNISAGSSVVPDVTISRREHRKGRKEIKTVAKDSLKTVKSTNKSSKIQHSDDGDSFKVKLIYDNQGYIVDFENLEEVLDKLDSREVEHTTITDNVLAHHGIKGMKWGVRKDGKPQGYQGGDSSSKKKKKVEVSSDFTISSGSRSVGLKRNRSRTSAPVRVDLSNEDMRRINERLRLENEMNRNLAELRKANMTRGQKARAHVGEVLLKSSKKAASTLLSGAMVDFGQKFMNQNKSDDSSSEKDKKPKDGKPKGKGTKNKAYNDPPRQPNPKPKKSSPKKTSTTSSKPNYQQKAYSRSESIRIDDLKVSTPRAKAKTTVFSVLEIQKKKPLPGIEGPKKK